MGVCVDPMEDENEVPIVVRSAERGWVAQTSIYQDRMKMEATLGPRLLLDSILSTFVFVRTTLFLFFKLNNI